MVALSLQSRFTTHFLQASFYAHIYKKMSTNKRSCFLPLLGTALLKHCDICGVTPIQQPVRRLTFCSYLCNNIKNGTHFLPPLGPATCRTRRSRDEQLVARKQSEASAGLRGY